MTISDNRRRLRTELTLAEKASLMSGANFWHTKPVERVGVPSIMLTDGPHGLRKQGGAADHLGLNASIPATCFPPAATLASSWDTDLLARVGAALGAEAAAEDVSVLLGPGLNIKRNPLAGRSFEYFSEDPLLSGTCAAALIRGIQSQGVAASAKHFAVNSQETHRMTIDEIVDERALHETYLEGFRIAVEQGDPWTVMSAYNKVNGTYANENVELLDRILRRTFGFDGLVVTDWGGNNDRVAGLVAGNALEMPSTDGATDREIVAAVEAGTLDESVLDARVAELLALIERTRRDDAPAPVDHDAHHELAVEAARRSIVLLDNPLELLPLRPESGRVAVIGDFAARPRYQGAGSSLVNPTRVESALDALRDSDLDIVGYEAGFARRDKPSRRLRRRAMRLARRADVVLLFLGLDESAEAEAVDRSHMRLAQNQLVLAHRLIESGVRVVVVLAGGAPVELPFADEAGAIVHSYLAGQGGGRAVADVLTGLVDPSGRLAETYPLVYADVPSSTTFARGEATAEHRESIYVGYRYFDKTETPVRFPFGHGLSYTRFRYTDLEAGEASARVTVTNVGEREGVETVQLYVEAPDAAVGQVRAPRELRGFAKVALMPGESATVEIPYADHAFDIYDVARGDWRTVGGTYAVLAGASSRDIRLRRELDVDGEPMPAVDEARLPHYVDGHVEKANDLEFEALLGRRLPSPRWPVGQPLTRDDIIAQTQGRGGFAGLLHRVIEAAYAVLMALGRPHAANNTRFVLDLPFRSVARMSGGRIDDAMLDGLLLMVNGRFWRGVRQVASAWRARRRSERVPSND
ncbi:glycoside hydrolase family 3 C-terminal domain-containing protein [Demequina sp. SYSU T00192]|uniref:Glycoside hydrolase family 3 C-terminal domain-containing protein n=1 Tax=Demequina litoralis TaxID=3051660 RepID=A0ABT8GAU4_9MICO|nr:glycoside hydrolase family 3 C-terminal domain-containing protein [Demequina sp. SYSU T00192]MDN4476260.1 glycoside hydrolase family 3 C-terminal domain-containing protein [Demequina sp. SYSU T00192]